MVLQLVIDMTPLYLLLHIAISSKVDPRLFLKQSSGIGDSNIGIASEHCIFQSQIAVACSTGLLFQSISQSVNTAHLCLKIAHDILYVVDGCKSAYLCLSSF